MDQGHEQRKVEDLGQMTKTKFRHYTKPNRTNKCSLPNKTNNNNKKKNSHSIFKKEKKDFLQINYNSPS